MAEPPAAESDFVDAEPWYQGGLRFRCTCCGNCCTGPPGVVRFTAEEGRAMADHLGVSEGEFYERHARKIGGRWSLQERKTDYGLDCVFLDRRTRPGKALCGVYPGRPRQCSTWPFWPENLDSPKTWQAVKRDTPCPGMDQGGLVTIDRIRILRDDPVTQSPESDR